MHRIYLLLYLTAISVASLSAQPYNQPLFISCGQTKSTSSSSSPADAHEWKSDEETSFAPPDLKNICSTTNSNADPAPYDTGRVFRTQLTYRFSLTPGPKFIRLHFAPSITYNNIPASQYFVSLQANHVILLKNFSPSLNSPNKNKMYEFQVTVEEDSAKNLNLTFSAGDNNSNSCGFINGIEIVPVPQGLYIDYNLIDKAPKYLTNPAGGYSFSNLTALQNVYRLNVGGDYVKPMNDAGNMWRTWFLDQDYLAPGGFQGQAGGVRYDTIQDIHINYTQNTPEYVAPSFVYSTRRIIGKYPVEVNMKRNITWRFQVHYGFDYLLRLHFCEMDINITSTVRRFFDVYINNLKADGLDVFRLSGGLGVPVYRDYIIRVGEEGAYAVQNATKVPLSLALLPKRTQIADVLLNGLEIFRLSELDGNSTSSLAVPNPPQPPSPPSTIPVGKGSNTFHSILITGGAIGGAILLSLVIVISIVACKWGANKEDTTFGSKSNATNTSSRYKWIPNIFHSAGSTASTTNPSLPSDLCRHFTLAQIMVATSNFDKNLIIGKGGFGEVYKGSILNAGNNETIQVAIKRLHTKSKQGVREFQTEIEMLSRLRHVHLVSLIGYCEDEGEMILVYEYMSNGTLRDHLMYKNSEKNDHNKTPLSWIQRLRICLGSARGLHYLHGGARQLIIHRDVKTTNILLDDKWTAKVSDFGLSKAGPISLEMGPTYISTAVKGSAGYLDPEYYRNQQLTEKSDVYSFGVVLFEVLCARAAVNPYLPKEQANLAMWAQSHYKKGTLNTIVDPNIASQIAPECLRKFGEIAELCVRDHGSERPSMGDVVWGLEFSLQLQEIAEKSNSLSGDSLEVSDPTCNSNLNVGDDGNTDNEMFTNSGNNFSRSSNGGVAIKRLVMDSKTTASSSSDYGVTMKSESVFSEIMYPTAR